MVDNQNPTIHFSIQDGRWDATVKKVIGMSFKALRALLLEEHIVSDSKDVLLFSPWKYKTKMNDYEPRTNDDGTMWLDETGNPVVGRLATNVIHADVICLDYDGTLSLEDAKLMFEPYTYAGYTSYSHKSHAKGYKDCFRIVLPLAKPMSPDDVVERRDAIYAWSRGADKTSLSLARSFYLPSCPADRLDVAERWENDGKLFDWTQFERRKAPVFEHRASSDELTDEKREQITEHLQRVYVGQEPVWYKIAISMASNGFTYRQFVQATINGLMKQKTERDCEKKWKQVMKSVNAGKTISVGYLVNVCKNGGHPIQGGNRKFGELLKQFV